MRKTISIDLTSAMSYYYCSDTIRQGDYDAYDLVLTFTDQTVIAGANLKFVRSDDQITNVTPSVDGNEISYTLSSALASVAGDLICFVQMVDSNLYTPVKIYFRVLDVDDGTPVEDLDEYPDWLAAITQAEEAAATALAAASAAETYIETGAYTLAENADGSISFTRMVS